MGTRLLLIKFDIIFRTITLVSSIIIIDGTYARHDQSAASVLFKKKGIILCNWLIKPSAIVWH